MELVLDDRARHRHWLVRPYRWYVIIALLSLGRHLLLSPDDDVLMALPELYRYGREGHWFNMKLFIAYMLDGIMQVSSGVHPLLTLPRLITFTVCVDLLPHPIHLQGAHFPNGWLRRLPIRVFHRHGNRRCPDG